MKLTNERVIEAHGALEYLSGERLNQATALQVMRMKRALKPLREDVADANDRIVKELGLKEGDGPTHARFQEYADRRKELYEIEVDVVITPLKLADLWARDYKTQERALLDLPARVLEQLGELVDLDDGEASGSG